LEFWCVYSWLPLQSTGGICITGAAVGDRETEVTLFGNICSKSAGGTSARGIQFSHLDKVAAIGNILKNNTDDWNLKHTGTGYSTGIYAFGNIGTTESADIIPTSAFVQNDKASGMAEGTLTAGAADAFAFAWQNPHAAKIIVEKLVIDVTTAGGTATAVLNVGSAANATTESDNLIDGADLNAIAVYDNIDDQGENGKSKQKIDEKDGTTDYVTGRITVEAATSLVGKYYIYYTIIN